MHEQRITRIEHEKAFERLATGRDAIVQHEDFLGRVESDFTVRANLGDVYEQLLNDLRGAGNAGEFYTPRAITQFMADRLNPSLAKRETVMDPACGTGGFLTAAIDHFRHQITGKSGA